MEEVLQVDGKSSVVVTKRNVKTKKVEVNTTVIEKPKENGLIDELLYFIFPNLPANYPLRKKIQISMLTTTSGHVYMMIQDIITVLLCFSYVIIRYSTTRNVIIIVSFIEIVMTQFAMLDYFLNGFIDGKLFYIFKPFAVLDVLTMFPTYVHIVTIFYHLNIDPFVLDIIDLLKLPRIIRLFKLLRFHDPWKKMLFRFLIIIMTIVFVAAGIVQFLESTVPQQGYQCQYINEETNWKPSCSKYQEYVSVCDCDEHNCQTKYKFTDPENEPSEILCERLDFVTAMYYIVVTTSLIGYGDISPSSYYTKAFICLLIMVSFTMIPIELNELISMSSNESTYRKQFIPRPDEKHVILSGHVNDRVKLEKFLKEFFHPDRLFQSFEQFHCVVFSPIEPSDDIRDLILSSQFVSHVTYIIGSALNSDDLKRVRADSAVGMFFLCNVQVTESLSHAEDSATVMRALSVSNFNPHLSCLVQVLRPEDRVILQDSEIDVIICLDEFRTALMAKNIVCPGFTTFVENIFHSFGNISPADEAALDPWYREYLRGSRMELYFVHLDLDFLRAINFDYCKLCEGIFLEYDTIVMAMSNLSQSHIIFNPTKFDMFPKFKTYKEFFEEYCIALIIADDQCEAEEIGRGLCDIKVVNSIILKLLKAEKDFPIRQKAKKLHDEDDADQAHGLSRDAAINAPEGRLRRSSLFKAAKRVMNATKVLHEDDIYISDNDDTEECFNSYVGYAAKPQTQKDLVVYDTVGSSELSSFATGRKNSETKIQPQRLQASNAPIAKAKSIPDKDVDSIAPVMNVFQATNRVLKKSSTFGSIDRKIVIDKTPNRVAVTNTDNTAASDSNNVSGGDRIRHAGSIESTDTTPPMTPLETPLNSFTKESDTPLLSANNPSVHAARLSKQLTESSINSKLVAAGTVVSDLEAISDYRIPPFQAHKIEHLKPKSKDGTKRSVITKSQSVPVSEVLKGINLPATTENLSGPSFRVIPNNADTNTTSSNTSTGKVTRSKLPKIKLKKKKSTESSSVSDCDNQAAKSDSESNQVSSVAHCNSESGTSVSDGGSYKSAGEAKFIEISQSGSGDSAPASLHPLLAQRRGANGTGSKFEGSHFEQEESKTCPINSTVINSVTNGNMLSDTNGNRYVINEPSNVISVNNANPVNIILTQRHTHNGNNSNSNCTNEDTVEHNKTQTYSNTVNNTSTSITVHADDNDDDDDPEESKDKLTEVRRSFTSVSTSNDIVPRIGVTQGLKSCQVTDQITCSDHIIIFGNDLNAFMFVSNLRHPSVTGNAYKTLVIVSKTLPPKWDQIESSYNDVYFVMGDFMKSETFNKCNVAKSFAIVLLAAREGLTFIDNEVIDSSTLLSYLKMESYIPRKVFFFTELTCASNMPVLNASFMRRLRNSRQENLKELPQTHQKALLKLLSNMSNTSQKSRYRASSADSIDDDKDSGGENTPEDGVESPGSNNGKSGRFTTRRSIVGRSSILRRMSMSKNNLYMVPHSIPEGDSSHGNSAVDEEEQSYDKIDTHHMLPVFASGRAYVAASFESLLVQSFFSILTPVICEKLVCGQGMQCVIQVEVPLCMVNRTFLDIFRIFSLYHVRCFGLLRTPDKEKKSWLSYAFISPQGFVQLKKRDCLFLFGKESRVRRALQHCQRTIERLNENNES